MNRSPNQKKNKRGVTKLGYAVNSESNPQRKSAKKNYGSKRKSFTE
jgi:hypothetical protein